MIYLYRALFLPLFIVALPHYLKRMLRRGGYGATMRGRLGLAPRLGTPAEGVRRLWVQAVSVGELQAITPVVEELLRTPGTQVVLSVTTSTAWELARKRFKGTGVTLTPFPLDFWPCSVLAWRRLQPHLILMMEGELWPEHLHQARRRGVPVVLANARLSDRSYRRYRRFRAFARSLMLKPLTLVLAGNAQDAERFERLGLQPHRLRFIGQLKCDIPMEPTLDATERAGLRHALFPSMGTDGLILLGSSTWPGEETFLLEVLDEAREECGDVRLLLVPRHAERRDEIVHLLEAQDLPWQLRSREREGHPETVVYVADTTGELRVLTQAADTALIGKSLPPHTDGQTPIEAVALGIGTVMGPGMANFRDVAQSLRESHAAIQAFDRESVKACLLELLRNPDRRRQLGVRGREWHAAQRGARGATVAAIEQLMGAPAATAYHRKG